MAGRTSLTKLTDTKSANVHDRLARSIGERILAGEYAPGTLLPNEAEWGRIYNVSRTAVREAIKTLTGKGLLLSRPKIGSRVEPRDRWNLLDRNVLSWHRSAIDRRSFATSTQEARRIIEPGIAELAARKRTAEQLDRLVAAVGAMRDAKSVPENVAADVEFHEALLQSANNDLLMPFGIIIEQALRNLFDYTSQRNPRLNLALRLHENIVRAVVAQDGEAARIAMLKLIDDTDAVIGATVVKRK
jgi:DNA-binding FadR family transcriptional regulator